jgi:CSLREA domain-containing protein
MTVAMVLLAHGGSPFGPAEVEAATFVVTRTDDPGPDGCNSGFDCSLREAIIAANADTSEPHVIQLQSGAIYTLAIPGAEDAAAAGDLDVVADVELTIEVAGGGTATVRQTATDRVFHVMLGGSLTLSSITVTGGNVIEGGGILNAGMLALTNSTVNFNAADRGGGINNVEGTVMLTNSTLSGNTADFGAGIVNDLGTLTLTSSTVSGNTASFGGGIQNVDGSVTVSNSTISGNTAAFGGGIYSEGTLVTLTNTTVTANIATEVSSGGGIDLDGGELVLTNSIIADQTGGAADCVEDVDATITSNGNNLDSDGTCITDGVNDDITGNANLGPLLDNGGPTLTRALLSGSEAIDAGNNAVCAAPPVNGVDQRGIARPQDGDANGDAVCDIGAYEVQAPGLAVTKFCVGEGFEASFQITAAHVTAPAECGDTVTASGLPPGDYIVGESISGPDAAGFATLIACDAELPVMSTTATASIPEGAVEDVTCVIINFFEPDGVDEDAAALICFCSLDLEIDIDNTNTNVIGIENDNDNDNANDNSNANTNDNANTNSQDQDNAQDQDNQNGQANNITSSPEVNIDFGQ